MGRSSLAVQCLGLHASTAGGPGSIPGLGTKILQAARGTPPSKKKKKKTSIGYLVDKTCCKTGVYLVYLNFGGAYIPHLEILLDLIHKTI